MTSALRFFSCKGLNVLEQLHLEETILRKSTQNVCLFNVGSPTSIVVGFSGKIPELLNVNEVFIRQTPVIRRYTGGGTVIVDKNTIFVTLILNSADVKTRPYPREIMDWTSTFLYDPVFSKALSNPELKFSLREHDYTINDKKIGGNAQSITKNRWVHHTSFLWDFDQANMNLLQIPKKRPEYRQNRDHSSFVSKLNLHLDSKENFKLLLINQLKSQFTYMTIETLDLSSGVKSMMDDLLIDTPVELRPDVIRTKIENITDFMIEDDIIKHTLLRSNATVMNNATVI